MKRMILILFLGMMLTTSTVRAQAPSLSEPPVGTFSAVDLVATNSGEATPSAGIVERKVEEKQDLTQPSSQAKNKLEQILLDHPVGTLSWNNFMRYAIEQAVKNGLPVNTVILIVLFPLVVAIVAASRHLIGVRGIGILTPALLSVAFLATGIWAGVGLFLVILLVATTGRILLRKLKLQYLPRMALLLWFVSAGVLSTLFAAAQFSLESLLTVGIFPILILMLLAETFIDIQVGRSATEAREIIFQTFILAMISSLLLAWEGVQRIVLLQPELVFVSVAVFDVILGKYTGLRLTEYLMYRRVAGEEEE